MAEQPLSALDPGLRRQVEHARTALDRGNLDYAIDLFRDVLRREPAYLSVRKVLRTAQLKRATLKLGLKRVFRLACHVPMLAWAQLLKQRAPSRAMDRAERVLDWNPRHHRASTILATAASTCRRLRYSPWRVPARAVRTITPRLTRWLGPIWRSIVRKRPSRSLKNGGDCAQLMMLFGTCSRKPW